MCAINTVILPLLVPFPYCTLHSLAWLDGGVSCAFLLCSTFETVPFPVSADCSFRCAIGSGGRNTTVHGKFYFVHTYMYCTETMPNLFTHCTLLDMWSSLSEIPQWDKPQVICSSLGGANKTLSCQEGHVTRCVLWEKVLFSWILSNASGASPNSTCFDTGPPLPPWDNGSLSLLMRICMYTNVIHIAW